MSDIEKEPSCKSCGVPWVDHMGIMGICAENAKLRKERDEAVERLDKLEPPRGASHMLHDELMKHHGYSPKTDSLDFKELSKITNIT